MMTFVVQVKLEINIRNLYCNATVENDSNLGQIKNRINSLSNGLYWVVGESFFFIIYIDVAHRIPFEWNSVIFHR